MFKQKLKAVEPSIKFAGKAEAFIACAKKQIASKEEVDFEKAVQENTVKINAKDYIEDVANEDIDEDIDEENKEMKEEDPCDNKNNKDEKEVKDKCKNKKK